MKKIIAYILAFIMLGTIGVTLSDAFFGTTIANNIGIEINKIEKEKTPNEEEPGEDIEKTYVVKIIYNGDIENALEISTNDKSMFDFENYTKNIDGYDFAGWYILTQSGYSPIETENVIITSDTTFYAMYNEIGKEPTLVTLTIIYNGNEEDLKYFEIKENDTINLNEYVLDINGFKFIGWYFEGEDGLYPIGEILTIVDNITLHASYEISETPSEEEFVIRSYQYQSIDVDNGNVNTVSIDTGEYFESEDDLIHHINFLQNLSMFRFLDHFGFSNILINVTEEDFYSRTEILENMKLINAIYDDAKKAVYFEYDIYELGALFK